MKKIICQTVIITLLVVLLHPLTIHAETDSDLVKNVIMAASMTEELVKVQYEKSIEEIKQKILENGWNYTYTMQSLDDNDDIYADINMDELIAILSFLYGNNTKKNAYDIQLLKVNIEEKVIKENIPKKLVRYKETEDGYYGEAGIYYATKSGEYNYYEQDENGHYILKGKQYIELDTKDITYADVEIKMKSIDEILEENEFTKDTVEKDLKQRVRKIKTAGIETELLNQTVFIKTILETNSISEEQQELIAENMQKISSNRQTLLSTALSLVGKVPYQWGGKASIPGYDTRWWTYENGKQKGLDCSGFVQWAFITSGYPEEIYNHLLSTSIILSSYDTIVKEDLIPGDLGLLNYGQTTNHVGIYLGDGLWVHCSSGAETVVINKFEFNVFVRVDEADDCYINPYALNMPDQKTVKFTYTDNELNQLAGYIEMEMSSKGVNEWIKFIDLVKAIVEDDTNEIYSVTDYLVAKGYDTSDYEIKPKEKIVSLVKMTLDGYTKIEEEQQL